MIDRVSDKRKFHRAVPSSESRQPPLKNLIPQTEPSPGGLCFLVLLRWVATVHSQSAVPCPQDGAESTHRNALAVQGARRPVPKSFSEWADE